MVGGADCLTNQKVSSVIRFSNQVPFEAHLSLCTINLTTDNHFQEVEEIISRTKQIAKKVPNPFDVECNLLKKGLLHYRSIFLEASPSSTQLQKLRKEAEAEFKSAMQEVNFETYLHFS